MTVEDTDRAEVKAYRPGVNRSKGPKNRLSQLVLVLGFFATAAGGFLVFASGGNARLIGYCLLVVGLPALVVTAVWAFRNWDY